MSYSTKKLKISGFVSEGASVYHKNLSIFLS